MFIRVLERYDDGWHFISHLQFIRLTVNYGQLSPICPFWVTKKPPLIFWIFSEIPGVQNAKIKNNRAVGICLEASSGIIHTLHFAFGDICQKQAVPVITEIKWVLDVCCNSQQQHRSIGAAQSFCASTVYCRYLLKNRSSILTSPVKFSFYGWVHIAGRLGIWRHQASNPKI